jgi:trehalose 6-phosphate phosphatase
METTYLSCLSTVWQNLRFMVLRDIEMSIHLEAVLREELSAVFESGEQILMAFDYDGTLSDHVSQPSLAVLDLGMRRTLAQLSFLEGVTVAVISSRGLSDLKRLVPIPAVLFAGSGGLELDLDGDTWHDSAVSEFDSVKPILGHLLAPLLRRYPGAWVEPKPGCLAVHYRNLFPLARTNLKLDLDAALGNWSSLIRWCHVALACEVSLVGGATKGDALRNMVNQLPLPSRVAYFGDAVNDVPAMELANRLGGVTVGMGDDPPDVARHRLATPYRLAACLADLVNWAERGRRAFRRNVTTTGSTLSEHVHLETQSPLVKVRCLPQRRGPWRKQRRLKSLTFPAVSSCCTTRPRLRSDG